MALRKLGQIFVDLGFISDDQLEMLIEEQNQHPGQSIGKIGEDMGLITDEQLIQSLAEQFRMQTVDIEGFTPPEDARTQVSDAMAQLYRVVPLQLNEGVLTVATCDPQNLAMQDELRRFVGHEIRMLIATENQIKKAIDKFYNAEAESIEKIIQELAGDEALKRAASLIATEGPINLSDVSELVDSAPVRKLLNMVLLLAIKDHASDIHFEPFEDEFRIRIKSDGVLYEMVPPPRHLAFAITTRIKVMANLDIAERRLPQDGRIELTVGGHPIDLRVSVLPTMFGESVVLRVLDRSVVSLDLNNVGMDEPTMARVPRGDLEAQRDHPRHRPDGLGQDDDALFGALRAQSHRRQGDHHGGSGRVRHRRDHSDSDRPRHRRDVCQCLRAILRQDPDNILVGEIRDLGDGRDRHPGFADRAHWFSARCTRTTRRAR